MRLKERKDRMKTESQTPKGLAAPSGQQLDAYATSGSSPPSNLISLYMTAAEAAAYLRISIQTLYNLRCQGKLRGFNRGGNRHAPLLFQRAELEDYLHGRPKLQAARGLKALNPRRKKMG